MEHCPKWERRAMVRITAKALRAAGLDVRYSPQDCTIQALADGHASLLGVTREDRERVLAFLDHHVDALTVSK